MPSSLVAWATVSSVERPSSAPHPLSLKVLTFQRHVITGHSHLHSRRTPQQVRQLISIPCALNQRAPTSFHKRRHRSRCKRMVTHPSLVSLASKIPIATTTGCLLPPALYPAFLIRPIAFASRAPTNPLVLVNLVNRSRVLPEARYEHRHPFEARWSTSTPLSTMHLVLQAPAFSSHVKKGASQAPRSSTAARTSMCSHRLSARPLYLPACRIDRTLAVSLALLFLLVRLPRPSSAIALYRQ